MKRNIKKIREEGMDIAKKLGNGVRYVGPQIDNGELVFHYFDDGDICTFVAKTIEEARERLIEKRRLFKAPAPIF